MYVSSKTCTYSLSLCVLFVINILCRKTVVPYTMHRYSIRRATRSTIRARQPKKSCCNQKFSKLVSVSKLNLKPRISKLKEI